MLNGIWTVRGKVDGGDYHGIAFYRSKQVRGWYVGASNLMANNCNQHHTHSKSNPHTSKRPTDNWRYRQKFTTFISRKHKNDFLSMWTTISSSSPSKCRKGEKFVPFIFALNYTCIYIWNAFGSQRNTWWHSLLRKVRRFFMLFGSQCIWFVTNQYHWRCLAVAAAALVWFINQAVAQLGQTSKKSTRRW